MIIIIVYYVRMCSYIHITEAFQAFQTRYQTRRRGDAVYGGIGIKNHSKTN